MFLKKSEQKSKIHCRNLSIFNIAILNISIKILPFVSIIHDQLCTGGWQIAGRSTGNGQCNADPQVAACRIPDWSCCTDLHSRELVWFPTAVWFSTLVTLSCAVLPPISGCFCAWGFLLGVQGWLWAPLSRGWALLALHRARTPWSAAGAPAVPGSASGADGRTAQAESRAHCTLGKCFPCFTGGFSCFESWEIL